MLEWTGLNSYYYDGLQPKMRAAIINEHECRYCQNYQKLHASPKWSFREKKKFKMADSKKLSFSTPPILNIFFQKFHRLVLGLVGLNDAKGIEVAQRI